MAKRDRELNKTERAQLAIKEQEAAERKRRMFVIGAIVAVLAIIVGLGVMLQSLKSKDAVNSAANPKGATADYGLVIGDPAKAEHKVVVFEDYLCPACDQFETGSNAQLAAAAAAGKASIEYRPFELLGRMGDYSRRAANAFWVVLDASGPEVAKKFHDELYANQPPESGPHPDDQWLIDKAVAAGAKEADIKDGIEKLKFEGFVERSNDSAARNQVTGTPTIQLDGKEVTAEELLKAIS